MIYIHFYFFWVTYFLWQVQKKKPDNVHKGEAGNEPALSCSIWRCKFKVKEKVGKKKNNWGGGGVLYNIMFQNKSKDHKAFLSKGLLINIRPGGTTDSANFFHVKFFFLKVFFSFLDRLLQGNWDYTEHAS